MYFVLFYVAIYVAADPCGLFVWGNTMCCNVVLLGCGPQRSAAPQSYEKVIKFFILLRYMTGQSIVS